MSIRSAGAIRVEADGQGGCGEAWADLSVRGRADETEDDPDYHFSIIGSITLRGETDVLVRRYDGCFNWSFGHIGESHCLTDQPQTIEVNRNGTTEFSASFDIYTQMILLAEPGSAFIEWDLTVATWRDTTCSLPSQEEPPHAAGEIDVPMSGARTDSEEATAAEECAPVTVTVSNPGTDDFPVEEGASLPAIFSLRLSGPINSPVTVAYETLGSPSSLATEGQDYEQTQGQVTFLPATGIERTFAVQVLDDDVPEPDETFEVAATVVDGPAVMAGTGIGIALVRDDDCGFNMPNHMSDNNVLVPTGTTGAVCGSIFRDVIRGRPEADVILGGASDDVLIGRGGPDEIDGGPGHDLLFGGFGSSSSFGGPGVDESRDHLIGGPGSDGVDGEAGDDIIEGGEGDDHLSGGAGSDDIAGEAGTDTIFGGAGEDTLYASSRSAGAGWVAYSSEVTNDELFGEEGDDTMYGSNGDNLLEGGADDDEIYGHQGRDALRGGEGNDSLSDWLGSSGDTVQDTLEGGNGSFDRCFGSVNDQKNGCEISI